MLPEINLLPEYKRHRSISYILIIIGLIVTIILSVMLAVFFVHFKAKLNDAEEQYNQLVQEKEILEQKLTTLESSQIESFEGAVDFAEQLVLPASILIEELVLQLPQNSYLKSYNYNYGFVKIQSEHERMSDVATYVNNLSTSEFFRDVKLNEVESIGVIDFDRNNNFYQAVHSIGVDRLRLSKEIYNNE